MDKQIKEITADEFKRYGKAMEESCYGFLANGASSVELPQSGCKYVASLSEIDNGEAKAFYTEYFGGLNVQVGLCYGYNNTLNCLEWHKSNEVNVALTDMILLLGRLEDIDADGFYDTSKIERFLVKKGQAVELYSTTLHFCPVQTGKGGFKCVVVLPEGTNTPLQSEYDDKRITAKNKWLVCHPDSPAAKTGKLVGLKGENIRIEL